jgi:hypothetical protein
MAIADEQDNLLAIVRDRAGRLHAAAYFQVKGGFNEIILVLLAVPRLHDIGKSGWWAGGVFLAEIVLATVAALLLPAQFAMMPLAIFVVIVFGLLIWLGTIPGQPGANKYGEPPRFGWRRRAQS